MNPLKSLTDHLVVSRMKDEAYYAAAFEEYQSGAIRPGIMAKALTLSKGNQVLANAKYLELLSQAIKDDTYIIGRIEENVLRRPASPRIPPPTQYQTQPTYASGKLSGEGGVVATIAEFLFAAIFIGFILNIIVVVGSNELSPTLFDFIYGNGRWAIAYVVVSCVAGASMVAINWYRDRQRN